MGAMYSIETQDCCNLRTIIDKSTHACCGNEGPYELATHGCCNGQIYDKEEEICCNDDELYSKSEGDTCCGNVPYDPMMSTCCMGQVKPGIGKCCGNDIYQPSTELCCQTIEGSVVHTPDSHDFSLGAVQCCGTDTYRPADELCCNMVVYTKYSASLKCCDTTAYNENTEICCQGTVSLRGTANGCCGPHPYNDDDEVCCDDELIPFQGHGSCCDDEPYNKEISSCPTLYGLTGVIEVNVPEIPGITMYHYGSNLTAYLSTEQFECGGSLHYYDEDATDCCAGAITYSSTQYLCCTSKMYTAVVRKGSPNAMCCGEQSYNPETEGCCHEHELYDLSTQQCCPESGVRGMTVNCYDVPSCSVERGNDRICTIGNGSSNDSRSVTYNSKNAVCTSSGVAAVTPGLASCGEIIYRTSQELCCQDELFPKFIYGKERQCCQSLFDRKVFVPAFETCYKGRIFPIPTNESRICGGHLYDSRYDGCDVVGRIRRREEILEKPDACYNDQTGLFYFNKLHHSCCAGHLIVAGHTCCDVSSECCQPNERQGYNTETHMCCDGNLMIKKKGHVCCGTQTYDGRDSSQLCCLNELHDSHNGKVRCEGETITGRLAENQIICRGNIYTGNNIECCGAEKYDLEEEICCRDFKYPKASDNLQCCGSVAYDSSDDVLCCGGSLYQNPYPSEGCCGNVTFDLISETCCTTGGSKFVTSQAAEQCCSNGEEFDSSLHTCCDGLIHKYIADGECCGNQVIRDVNREFCCDGRLVHHHGDKKCCHGQPISLNEECHGEVVSTVST
ncbi:Galaxin [Holothuria leucospilota]|uniref:Galaxin n=1 Tax=Holothuria leucospilota TaxID=206669 RepID=A0A9Q1CGL6_HOLLE|nr:Galaxin [Holothuria leucospilota]